MKKYAEICCESLTDRIGSILPFGDLFFNPGSLHYVVVILGYLLTPGTSASLRAVRIGTTVVVSWKLQLFFRVLQFFRLRIDRLRRVSPAPVLTALILGQKNFFDGP